jgi:hypothetical protein
MSDSRANRLRLRHPAMTLAASSAVNPDTEVGLEPVITTVIGLLGGLALSAVFWYWTMHIIQPSIEFSPDVSRITDATGAVVYRVKLRNASQRRGVIDLTFGVSIRYPTQATMSGARPSLVVSFGVATRNAGMYRLAPRRTHLIDMNLSETLRSDSARDIIAALFPVEVQREGLDFEALLRRSAGAHLVVHVLCYDEWSGARRYFKSKSFVASDIKEGFFDGMTVPRS